MIIKKANNKVFIGINGRLATDCHLLSIGGFSPKIKLIVKVKKPQYYLCGFGEKIKSYFVHVSVTKDYNSFIPVWWKKTKYCLTVHIKWTWLWNVIDNILED